jgi:hypothetical protein
MIIISVSQGWLNGLFSLLYHPLLLLISVPLRLTKRGPSGNSFFRERGGATSHDKQLGFTISLNRELCQLTDQILLAGALEGPGQGQASGQVIQVHRGGSITDFNIP